MRKDNFLRMKTMQAMLDRQYQLTRLIVQKMEIVSEADQLDEGAQCDCYED